MNTSDLRDLLAERATSHTTSSADATVTGVLTRATSIRRNRRLAAGAAALAVTAAAVAAINLPVQLSAPKPVPQPAEQVNEDGFRLYEHGWELLASGVMRAGETTVSVTATPTAFPLIVAHRCGEGRIYAEDEDFEEINVEVAVEGEAFTDIAGSCGRGWDSNDADGWAARGVVAGEAAMFMLTADEPVTAEAEIAVGIYQAVPWDEYPFPPRPDVLPDLPGGSDDADAVVESDHDDPNAVREFTVSAPFSLHTYAQTPGILRVWVDGTELDPIYSWDYGYSPDISSNWPPPDAAVRSVEPPLHVEIRPEGFTGRWEIHVREN
jgi:hypothetical protein